LNPPTPPETEGDLQLLNITKAASNDADKECIFPGTPSNIQLKIDSQVPHFKRLPKTFSCRSLL